MEFTKEQLQADVDYLLARAAHAGICRFSRERDYGTSSNAIVALAYSGTIPVSMPSDPSDLAACELAVQRLPEHRKSPEVVAHLEKCRDLIAVEVAKYEAEKAVREEKERQEKEAIEKGRPQEKTSYVLRNAARRVTEELSEQLSGLGLSLDEESERLTKVLIRVSDAGALRYEDEDNDYNEVLDAGKIAGGWYANYYEETGQKQGEAYKILNEYLDERFEADLADALQECQRDWDRAYPQAVSP